MTSPRIGCAGGCGKTTPADGTNRSQGRQGPYRLALANGQLAHPERCGHGLDGPKLYSEGLY
jgi:hypothetical protein